MLLSIPQYVTRSPTIKIYVALNANSAKVENTCLKKNFGRKVNSSYVNLLYPVI